VGDRTKTDLPYPEARGSNHAWENIRTQEAITPETIVRQAEAATDR
jgi:glucarate dehydratase